MQVLARFEEEIERMNEEESAGLEKTVEEGQHGISVHSAMGKERGQSAGRDRPPLLKRRQSSLEIELSLTKKMPTSQSKARPEATASTKYEEAALRDGKAPEKAALFEQERYSVPVLRLDSFISMLILIWGSNIAQRARPRVSLARRLRSWVLRPGEILCGEQAS